MAVPTHSVKLSQLWASDDRCQVKTASCTLARTGFEEFGFDARYGNGSKLWYQSPIEMIMFSRKIIHLGVDDFEPCRQLDSAFGRFGTWKVAI